MTVVYTLLYGSGDRYEGTIYCGTYDTREAAEAYMTQLQDQYKAPKTDFSLFQSSVNKQTYYECYDEHDLIYQDYLVEQREEAKIREEKKRLAKEAEVQREREKQELAHRRILIDALVLEDCLLESMHGNFDEGEALASLIEDSKTCANYKDAFFAAKSLAIGRRVEFNMNLVGEFLRPAFRKKLEDVFAAAGVL